MSNLALVRFRRPSMTGGGQDSHRSMETSAQQTSIWTLVLSSGGEGPFGQFGDAVLEAIEERIVGRAGQAALVGTLQEHGRLPQRERRVPVQAAHRAPRALLVARDELLAGGEARSAGDRAEREADALGVAGPRPRGERVGD